jgi:hypothetical protein
LPTIPKIPPSEGGAACCATGGCICNLTSFILAGAFETVTVLVGSARRLLRESHLFAPRLFAVGSTETTREIVGHTYSKTDTLFAVQSKAYTEEEEC